MRSIRERTNGLILSSFVTPLLVLFVVAKSSDGAIGITEHKVTERRNTFAARKLNTLVFIVLHMIEMCERAQAQKRKLIDGSIG